MLRQTMFRLQEGGKNKRNRIYFSNQPIYNDINIFFFPPSLWVLVRGIGIYVSLEKHNINSTILISIVSLLLHALAGPLSMDQCHQKLNLAVGAVSDVYRRRAWGLGKYIPTTYLIHMYMPHT